MKSIIYIKYGELTLKGKNKIDFINCLFNHVRHVLNDIKNIKFIKKFDALIITNVLNKDKDKIFFLLKKIPGINLIIPAFQCSNNFNKLSLDIIKSLQKRDIAQTTFKINTKRANKKYPLNSMEISAQLGGVVLNSFKKYAVDVHNPKLLINVEIKDKYAIFYFEKIKGIGGLPLGINGRVLMLISGGIDSAVAANLLLKKGLHVDLITFISPPHTDEKALNKVRDLKKIITLDNTLYKAKLYIVNFTSLQHEISHIRDRSYQITILRRYYFRFAKQLGEKYNYQAIATGESLGQVASQTIQSMQTIQNSINDFLVLRPLLTMDKNEIIQLAKQMDTYDISILPYADSCSLFVPANPATKPTVHKAVSLEAELELAESIMDNIFKKHITIE
ncbi:MAG: tRNA 4-thiouridine(8) synthase ThiI [Mycoplasmataceae bacterium]|jgi:thiamine biosynthesis protein ThiI|nr:tRNA 4-thiouridine(8) synthase ThiI [Mycoplasmataceae bacterium]